MPLFIAFDVEGVVIGRKHYAGPVDVCQFAHEIGSTASKLDYVEIWVGTNTTLRDEDGNFIHNWTLLQTYNPQVEKLAAYGTIENLLYEERD